MRFIYRWHGDVIDNMAKALWDKFKSCELASPLDVPELDEADYAKIWWVPYADADQFRYTHEYADAKAQYGQVFEYKTLIEHSGQTWSGYFFVVYERQNQAAA